MNKKVIIDENKGMFGVNLSKLPKSKSKKTSKKTTSKKKK